MVVPERVVVCGRAPMVRAQPALTGVAHWAQMAPESARWGQGWLEPWSAVPVLGWAHLESGPLERALGRGLPALGALGALGLPALFRVPLAPSLEPFVR